MPTEKQLIAPCGMNCSLCVSYQSMVNDLNQKGFHKKYCAGCIPRGKNCTFMKRNCHLLGEGLVRFCHECDNFPCIRLKELDTRYRTKYHMSLVENLTSIRDFGIDQFLAKEQSKWICPRCSQTICCHNGLCLHCDDEILRKNPKYHWNE